MQYILVIYINVNLFYNDYMTPLIPSDHRSDRLNQWIAEHFEGVQAKFVAQFELNQGEISQLLLKKRTFGERRARKLETQAGIPQNWLDMDMPSPKEPPNASRAPYRVAMADSDDDSYEIPFYQVKGECGSGIDNPEPYQKGMLRKEHGWFEKYGVHPDHVACIYASGNSMQPYLLEGDMVFIDTRPTDPVSGEAYLINHPDGERIKRLRRTIDGSWVISSDNPDKSQHPDETVTPAHADQIRIIGRVFYRQG